MFIEILDSSGVSNPALVSFAFSRSLSSCAKASLAGGRPVLSPGRTFIFFLRLLLHARQITSSMITTPIAITIKIIAIKIMADEIPPAGVSVGVVGGGVVSVAIVRDVVEELLEDSGTDVTVEVVIIGGSVTMGGGSRPTANSDK